MNKKQKKTLIRIILAAVLIGIFDLFEFDHYLKIAVFLAAYLIVGYDILRKALKGLLHHEVFDENFLMAVATIGAIGLGDYSEGVMVMLFYQIGEFFQSYAIRRSRKNISDMMDIRPEFACLIHEDGELEEVDPSEVETGSSILVKVGEKVPIDGVILKGETTLNTAALTGESLPKEAHTGDEVISGCINLTAPIEVETSKAYEDSTVSKVLDLVENATFNKSKSEDFITKFAHYYTPIVVYSALALCILPPVVLLLMGKEANFQTWLMRSFTFLVISCPCALVISIPLSFFGSIGGASNKGILIKGSNYIEVLSKIKTVAFDKTGTMTKGVFEVEGIHHAVSDKYLLKMAAHAEYYSAHPIAGSIIKAYNGPIEKDKIESIKEIPGKGIEARIDSAEVLIGSEYFFRDHHISYIPCRSVGTIVHVAVNGEYLGHLVVSDIIKENSPKTIAALKDHGIHSTVLLTGDSQKIAEDVKEKLHIDQVYSELLPDHKMQIVQGLIQKEKTMFVGDGINDAPSISLADVGIAMGALGSDAAIEAADIVLMDDDPYKVVTALKIAKKCMRIVYENIYFSIGVKVVCLILTALGHSSMWMAIFADVGVMILAVLNAIRTLVVDK